MADNTIREQLEILKNQMYRELGRLKQNISNSEGEKGCCVNLNKYKPSKHQRANKRYSGVYRG